MKRLRDADVGNDLLIGGADTYTMIGCTGNDVYYVDNVGDTIIEIVNEGSDTIYTLVTFSLAGSASGVEVLSIPDIDGTCNGWSTLSTAMAGKRQ